MKARETSDEAESGVAIAHATFKDKLRKVINPSGHVFIRNSTLPSRVWNHVIKAGLLPGRGKKEFLFNKFATSLHWDRASWLKALGWFPNMILYAVEIWQALSTYLICEGILGYCEVRSSSSP